MAEKYLVRNGDVESEWEIERGADSIRVRRAPSEEWRTADLQRIGDSQLYLLMVDSRPTELYLERRRGGALATIGRHAFDYDVERWRATGAGKKGPAAASGLRRITAPMTGSIVEVKCSPGMTVEQGDVLIVIESMKMNNELRSPAAGVVEQVPVVAAQRVKAGDLLVALNLSVG